MRTLWQAIGSAVFWRYRRGSWQYDLMVAAILAFIFLTPREIFRDQPRPPTVQQIEALPGGDGTVVFLVEPHVVEDAQGELNATLRDLIRQRSGKDYEIVEVKPTSDPDGGVLAYLVYVRP